MQCSAVSSPPCQGVLVTQALRMTRLLVLPADAFMTGASFAALLPLVAGKIAADPTHELATAHSEALARAAEAAQAAPGTGSTHPLPLCKPLTQQQQPVQPSVQQPGTAAAVKQTSDSKARDQGPPGQQPQPAAAQQQQQQDCDVQPAQPPQPQQQPPSLLSYVSGVVGRLNVTFSDISYAALWGEDPVPERPGTFHLSGLQEGYRADEVGRMMRRAGLTTVGAVLLGGGSGGGAAAHACCLCPCLG